MVHWNGNEVTSNVRKLQDMLSSIDVSINTNGHVVKYPCKYFEGLDENEKDWYEPRYYMQSYADAYGVDLPPTAINRILQVSDLLPPEHKATAGRPRRSRIPSAARNQTIC